MHNIVLMYPRFERDYYVKVPKVVLHFTYDCFIIVSTTLNSIYLHVFSNRVDGTLPAGQED